MAIRDVDVHRWSLDAYEHMAETGVFHPAERVELIDGTIYDLTPQSSRHATGVRLVEEALRALCPQGYDLRVQMPLALAPSSAPEPDLAVVPGSLRDYRDAHPTTARLVVEISDSSLAYDRERKLPVYARAGIPEAWIVNLGEGVLEVYRRPAGSTWRSRSTLRPPQSISPLLAPDVAIPVATLLP
jgi:Uma2 family endonuclease